MVSMPTFEIDTGPESPGTVIIRGEIDLATAARVDAALSEFSGDIRVECSGVTFIDSAGFHAFDRAYKIAMQRGSVFAVAALPVFPARIGNLLELQYLEPPRQQSDTQRFGSAFEGDA